VTARGCTSPWAWAPGGALPRPGRRRGAGGARSHGGATFRRAAAATQEEQQSGEELLLTRWRLLPDGRFRGQLRDGLVIEFEGQLVGPTDPGVVLGPGGARYILGEAAPAGATTVGIDAGAADTAGEPQQMGMAQVAVAAATAATALVLAVLAASGSLQRPSTALLPFGNEGPVTRTNVVTVETRKVLPDGSTTKVIDRTTRKERIVPGKAPVVTESTMRKEKVFRDERGLRPPASTTIIVTPLQQQAK